MKVKPCANGRSIVSQQLPTLLDITYCVRLYSLLVSKVLWVLYPSHDALQVSTLMGVVKSVCTPLPTRTQQLQTLLGQQSWGLLRLFFKILIKEPQERRDPTVKPSLKSWSGFYTIFNRKSFFPFFSTDMYLQQFIL